MTAAPTDRPSTAPDSAPAPPTAPTAVAAFIARWQASGAAERANYQLFLSELCDVLGVARPDPTREDERQNRYVFEKAVTFRHADGTTSTGRIDLYKEGAFVLEAKQGADGARDAAAAALGQDRERRRTGTARRGTPGWDDAMLRARGQAEQYARALAEWPPFLVVVDVGHTFALYADFERRGKGYLPFPEPRSHRIALADLGNPAVQERLRLVFTDPMALDPARRAAEVTREVAGHLAALARSLETQFGAEYVADFLMRCLFTMFAEDVGLLPAGAFTDLLREVGARPDVLQPAIELLWRDMDRGGFSGVLRTKVLRFNGRFFRDTAVLPLTNDQVALLLEAAAADWSHVEPAIFGTLIERALDPKERHALGAHYTPRAYVERLVLPTVVEPLRREWDAVLAAVTNLLGPAAGVGDGTREALQLVRDFHARLCKLRVLDPACGTGNFLYVTFEHLKRLEGEVLQLLADLGGSRDLLELEGVTVGPHQLLGLEINPRAAAIAELVLWIGYLQWHVRTHGQVNPPEPVLRDAKNIECRDALLAYDRVEPLLDEAGQPVTRWDGETVKPHPVTGKPVPDERAQRPVVRYVGARRAEWPAADFVVSNPPFLGNKHMREVLGDPYVEAVRATYAEVPKTVDFVMYWWHRAADLARAGQLRRFGLITTNSIGQTQNRQVIDAHLTGAPPIRLVAAIADHPWVDEGADVRISMTVADPSPGPNAARLGQVVDEANGHERVDVRWRDVATIHADLAAGANVASAVPLAANGNLSFQGMNLVGKGFRLTPQQVVELGFDLDGLPPVIRPYLNAREFMQERLDRYVIDAFGYSAEGLRDAYPTVYQWLHDHVKPERDQNRDAQRRRDWWLFGRSNAALRTAVTGLRRYIATPETSKHRVFQLMDAEVCPDHTLYAIALDDAFWLGVLSSRAHTEWAPRAGGRMGIGNDPRYNNTLCFLPFPLPAATEAQAARIRELGEALDQHRKRQQAAHPGLTLTGMYNVLEKLRAGEALSAKEKVIHEQGLCSVLRELHADLDRAVFDAYGWPETLTDDDLLERLVALSAERAAEEARGLVRWLRPDFQCPGGKPVALPDAPAEQPELPELEAAPATPETPAPAAAAAKAAFPAALVARVQAVRSALEAAQGAVTAETIARQFKGAREGTVADILETLATLGQARRLEDGRFVA